MATSAYEQFLNFFESVGPERMDGLDHSFFKEMTENEKQQSFDYLVREIEQGGCEAVDGLKALGGPEIIDVFLCRMDALRKADAITEQRLSLSVSLWQLSGDLQYQKDMIKMLGHQNKFVRAGALSALGQTPTTPELLRRLENICLEDSAELVVMAAAQQLLKRYGYSWYDRSRAGSYRSIYRQMISEDNDEKKSALSRIKSHQCCNGTLF
jgi:hypothetical protein